MDRTGLELKDEQEGFRVREKRRMNMTGSGQKVEIREGWIVQVEISKFSLLGYKDIWTRKIEFVTNTGVRA